METMDGSIPFQQEQPIFNKVGSISELVNMSSEDRARYNISLDTFRTNLSVMKNERAEGRAEGEAIGMEKGRAEGRAEGRVEGEAIGKKKERIDIAQKLNAAGSPIELIMQVTGLSQEEIEQL